MESILLLTFFITYFEPRILLRINKHVGRTWLFLCLTSLEIYLAFCDNAVFQKLFVNIIFLHGSRKRRTVNHFFGKSFGDYPRIRQITTAACTFFVQNKKYE